MSADYDRLFQPHDGGEIPDEATAHTEYDVDSPAPTPPVSARPPKPNGEAAPPMPVDWTEQAPPSRPARPPMPVHWTEQSAAPQPRHAHEDDDSALDAHFPLSPGADLQPGHRKAATGPPMPLRPDPLTHAEPAEHWEHSAPDLAWPTGPAPGAPQHLADSPAALESHPAQPGSALTPATGDQVEKRPAADLDLKSKRKKKPKAPRLVSRRGWRRWVYKLTRINFGLSRDEKYELDLYTRIRRAIRGSYEIGVLSLKGGVGKTTVTVALGSAFAQVRGDKILALDADPVSGNLGDRTGRQTAATIADLVADKALSHYNDVRAHTSITAVNLEVLAAAEYSAPRYVLSDEDWQAVTVVPRYYNLVLADCGADLAGPATQGVLSAASGLVIVSSATIDGARQAAVAIDWLRHNRYDALLNRTCVVINLVAPGEPTVSVDDLVRRFEQDVRPGRVIVLPWEKHIAAGTEIQLDLLGETYKRRIIELAAALSDDFDKG